MRVALLLGQGTVAASCLARVASSLPTLRAERWVNSPPLTAEPRRRVTRRSGRPTQTARVDRTEYLRTTPRLKHLIALLEELQALGLAFVSLAEGIDATTPAGKLQMHILGAIA